MSKPNPHEPPPNDRGRCPNCGAAATAPFCGQCGQEQKDLLVTVGAWLKELLSELTSLDGRFLRSVGRHLRRPGWLDLEWKRGRRKRYVSPTRLYLLAAALFFFVSVVFPAPRAVLEETGRPSGGPLVDAAEGVVVGFITARAERAGPGDPKLGNLETLQLRAARWMASSFKWVMILGMVPALAILGRLFSGRSSDYLVSHLVASLHTHAFLFFSLVLCLLVLGTAARLTDPNLYRLGYPVVAAGFVIYLFLQTRKTSGRGWFSTALRTAATSLAYVSFLSLGVVAIGILAAVV